VGETLGAMVKERAQEFKGRIWIISTCRPGTVALRVLIRSVTLIQLNERLLVCGGGVAEVDNRCGVCRKLCL
jgi:hypothetical protein